MKKNCWIKRPLKRGHQIADIVLEEKNVGKKTNSIGSTGPSAQLIGVVITVETQGQKHLGLGIRAWERSGQIQQQTTLKTGWDGRSGLATLTAGANKKKFKQVKKNKFRTRDFLILQNQILKYRCGHNLRKQRIKKIQNDWNVSEPHNCEKMSIQDKYVRIFVEQGKLIILWV